MGFSMFSAQPSPIAIDFGSASVKLLQIGPGEPATLHAAAELPIPDSLRSERDGQLAFFGEKLPRLLRAGKFKGRRAVCSVPAELIFVQHMQISGPAGPNRDDLIKGQMQAHTGLPSHGMVVRTIEVTEVHREDQVQTEVICIAMGRDMVMRYVQVLKKCKLEAVGVHSGVLAMVRAFDHLRDPNEDATLTTLYADLGWGCTKVAIGHGDQIRFARCIQIGGQHFDQRLAKELHCDPASARAHRISEQVLATDSSPAVPPVEPSNGQGGPAPVTAATGVGIATNPPPAAGSEELPCAVMTSPSEPEPVHALSESADAVAEELSMCLRYDRSLFREQRVDRIIFLGGEARNVQLCQRIAKGLRLPAQLGDPLSRLVSDRSPRTPGLALGQPQPGWAVACGLCTAPTDL